MAEVGDGSMGSPPKFEYLPATENADGSMSVDISDLENPDVALSNSVNFAASHYRKKNKELRVKVPCCHFEFIALLSQMGFDRIVHAESTYIVLKEDISLQVAPGIKLKQRENIASSSKPCTLNICNETPDAALAVQTPSETGGDQGPEFQRSSRAFPSGPAGLGNDNEAAGLQGLSAGPEIPVQSKKRPRSATKSKRPLTRSRGPDYGDEEKGLLLKFRLEYLQDPANEGKSPRKWLMPVTDKMKENGYDRAPKSLQRLWETTKKGRDALRRAFPEGSTAYWGLTIGEKQALKKADRDFPLTFKREWVAVMENIEKMEPRRTAEKETRSDGQEGVFSQARTSTITGSANFAGPGSSDANIQAPRQQPWLASAEESNEDLQPVNPRPRRTGTLSSFIRDLPFYNNRREKSHQDLSSVMEQQEAVQRELTSSASKKSMENPSSSDSLFDFEGYLVQNFPAELAVADQARCNEFQTTE